MGVLATFAAALRTSLAASPASLTACPEGVDIDDVPDADKTYFAVKATGLDMLGNEHGGGTLVMHHGEILLQIRWPMDDDYEAFHDTKANDLLNVSSVIDKPANWSSGVVLVEHRATTENTEGNLHSLDRIYAVTYRESQTLI